MHRREYILATGAVLGASSIGAVAFTSATVTRDVTVDVVADNANAVIGLTPGVSGIAVDADGLLNIAPPASASADGLNPEASFTYGDAGDPTNVFAFSIDNNDSVSHDYTLSLTTDDVPLDVYDSTGTLQGTVDSTNSVTVTVASGSSAYVLTTIDTSGYTAGSTITDTLTITA